MENTKAYYWRISLIVIILFLGILIFIEFLPFLSGALGACTIYVLVRNHMKYLTNKRKIRRSLAAIIILFEVILCFLIPLSAIIWMLLDKVQMIDLNPNSLFSIVVHFKSLVYEKTGYNLFSSENLANLTSSTTNVLQIIIKQASSFTINAFVMLFILYFMLTGSEKMEAYLYDILPFNDKYKKDVLRETNMLVKSNAIGVPLLAFIQGVFAFIGYVIFKAPDPLLFAFLTCFATIIPLLGTGLVWFPLVVYFALTGNWFSAIGLTLYALLVIGNIDNLARFLLQKKMADTHPLITVFGVVIGLSLFGFWGVVFGPLLLSIFLLCFNIYKIDYIDTKKD